MPACTPLFPDWPTSAAPMPASRWKPRPGELGAHRGAALRRLRRLLRRGARLPGQRGLAACARPTHRRGGHRQSGQRRPGPHDQPSLAVFSRGGAPRIRLGAAADGQRLQGAGDGAAAAGRQRQRKVGGGAPRRGVLGLLGRGHRAGRFGADPGRGGWVALDSEGGHVTFAPPTNANSPCCASPGAIPHVSAERLMSGIGLELVYRALADRAGSCRRRSACRRSSPPRWHGDCPLCVETIDCFCAMLGTVAGNLAVTLGATGGMYIGGGIVPRLGDAFRTLGVPPPLRAEGPLQRLPGADSHLRHHRRVSGPAGRGRAVAQRGRGTPPPFDGKRCVQLTAWRCRSGRRSGKVRIRR